MSFKDGDFLKIEFSAWRIADNSLVFTTDEKKAKENNIFNKETRYGPQLVVLGKKNVIDGLDKFLRNANINEAKKVEIYPEDAFGNRRSELVQVMSINDFRRRDINPYPGMQLDLDGAVATVKSINSGRVLVDANHPLAGEKLLYEVTVVEKVDGEKEKIGALAEYYNLKPNSLEVKEGIATIDFGTGVRKDGDYFVNKTNLASASFAYIDSIKRVVINEEYDKESFNRKEQEHTHDHDHTHEHVH
jgi:peptidylprolyl isomerase